MERSFKGGKTTIKVWVGRDGIEASEEVTIYDPPLGGGAYLRSEVTYKLGGIIYYKKIDTFEPNPM